MKKLPNTVYYAGPIILMLISTILFMNNYLANSAQPSYSGPFIESEGFSSVTSGGSFNLSVEFTQTEFYKGGNINFSAELVVETNVAYFANLTIEVLDPEQALYANQSIGLHRTFNPGSYSINFTLSPGYDDGGFLALVDKSYTITEFYAFYTQDRIETFQRKDINHDVEGYLKPSYNQIEHLQWDVLEETNVILSQTNGIMDVESQNNPSSFTIQMEVETTGYHRLVYDITGLNKTSVSIQIDNWDLNLDDATSLGYIPIGTLQGKRNLTISSNIIDQENMTININMTTHYLPIYVVIANNNWDSEHPVGDRFQSPLLYVEVVSQRLEQTMNISLVPVAIFDFHVGLLTNQLSTMRNQAETDAGEFLNLKSDKWHEIPGTSPSNNGADILLVFTNRTMDHLGVVNKNSNGENVNVAMVAQGSRHIPGETPDDVEMRISPLWADNLIQHEFSHTLRAPDRWTDEDPPSVMTKSVPELAYADMLQENFWLFLTHWLEEDIQTMMSHQNIFR